MFAIYDGTFISDMKLIWYYMTVSSDNARGWCWLYCNKVNSTLNSIPLILLIMIFYEIPKALSVVLPHKLLDLMVVHSMKLYIYPCKLSKAWIMHFAILKPSIRDQRQVKRSIILAHRVTQRGLNLSVGACKTTEHIIRRMGKNVSYCFIVANRYNLRDI